MTNIIFLFGTIAGVIVAGSFFAVYAATGGSPEMSGMSEWLGYLTMIVALSMIFFGVKRYRDHDKGGVIRFLPALFMGLAISAVAGVIYVLGWEVYMAMTDNAFMEAYLNAYIAQQKAAGVTGAALEKLVSDMEAFKVQYANPLFRMPMTFMEIFPVGVIISLISAAILRNPKALPA